MTRDYKRLFKDKCLRNFEELKINIFKENTRQIDKWGIQERTSFEWLAYLTEEVGELSQAISEFEYRQGGYEEIKKEAMQVVVLALKIAEMMIDTQTSND